MRENDPEGFAGFYVMLKNMQNVANIFRLDFTYKAVIDTSGYVSVAQ